MNANQNHAEGKGKQGGQEDGYMNCLLYTSHGTGRLAPAVAHDCRAVVASRARLDRLTLGGAGDNPGQLGGKDKRLVRILRRKRSENVLPVPRAPYVE